ncbi:BrnA antitoxin family protein [Plantactinospora endophytica]|uniref:CopG family transcriptional regulator n=1 Tax=Plantactinospora endophytica TaxID=673535 RepID=A0ABQ4DWF6_9ACTN|nr:BrnA antitoxin family protein [Plantactinospora endophytica]GIG86783.1 hypothetical protein Pen02_17190 [Plantactinospora endophytica]
MSPSPPGGPEIAHQETGIDHEIEHGNEEEAVTMHRDDAVKRFHAGDDQLADLIDDAQPVELPTPDTDVPMVSRSVRLPLDTYERVRSAAEARGIGVTTLMRQWIEAGLADLDDSATVSLADVRRALAALAHPTAA